MRRIRSNWVALRPPSRHRSRSKRGPGRSPELTRILRCLTPKAEGTADRHGLDRDRHGTAKSVEPRTPLGGHTTFLRPTLQLEALGGRGGSRRGPFGPLVCGDGPSSVRRCCAGRAARSSRVFVELADRIGEAGGSNGPLGKGLAKSGGDERLGGGPRSEPSPFLGGHSGSCNCATTKRALLPAVGDTANHDLLPATRPPAHPHKKSWLAGRRSGTAPDRRRLSVPPAP